MQAAIRFGTTAAMIAVGLGVSASAWAGGRPDLVRRALEAGRPHAPGEVIVKYRDDASAASRAAVQRGLGAARADVLRAARGRSAETVLLRLPAGVDVATAVGALQTDPSVEYVEPNWIYQHAATSNDTRYLDGSLWGMYGDAGTPANAFGSQAAEAWAAGRADCGDVWVGIIDEGYMWSHEDLAANAGKNPGEVAGNGLDDDSNGYVDDVYGWDFAGGDSSVFDGTDDDHGTHVAGTIGGVGGNGKGVAGVCWNVRLIGAKFLGRRGGTTANAVKAVDYMTDLKTRHGLNLVATNNSWGGGGFSQALQDAIERANQAGILFIAAAGNSAYDCDSGSSCYPAEYPNANVVAVASITSSGAMSSFSSYGADTVDICAPGSGIWSTVPTRPPRGSRTPGSGYASYSGTSMATPHVAGAAALYKASHPSASAQDVKSALLGSAVPTASCDGKVASDGRLDVSGF
jgi:subtilisin family serine protease